MGTPLALCTKSSSLSMRTRTSMAVVSSLARQLFLQPPGDGVRNEAFDVPAEGGELLDPARAEETVLGRAHQVHRFDVVGLSRVELGHLELVFEVGDRTQAFHDRDRPDAPRELDDEHVERLGADVVEVARRLFDEPDPLLRAEHRADLAHRRVDHRDDELVVELRRAGDDVDVAVRHRVVGAGTDGDAVFAVHGRVWIVIGVSPYARVKVTGNDSRSGARLSLSATTRAPGASTGASASGSGPVSRATSRYGGSRKTRSYWRARTAAFSSAPRASPACTFASAPTAERLVRNAFSAARSRSTN